MMISSGRVHLLLIIKTQCQEILTIHTAITKITQMILPMQIGAVIQVAITKMQFTIIQLTQTKQPKDQI